jgi:amino acid transporter
VAGPEGTLLAFILLGLVAMAVMEGICEMIVLWPIPNAMVEFVRAFVDPDLAIVVGLSYWFVKLPWKSQVLDSKSAHLDRYTYCVTFTALIIGAGNLSDYWNITFQSKSVLFIVVPIGLALINALRIEVWII